MTLLAIAACVTSLALALVARDVVVRALAAQVRRAELALEGVKAAEVGALATEVEALRGRVVHAEREVASCITALSVGKATRR